MKKIIIILCTTALLSGCTLRDVTVREETESATESKVSSTSSVTDPVVSDNSTATATNITTTTLATAPLPEINLTPELAERFYPGKMADGVLYVTVESAAYYHNIHDAGVAFEDLWTEMQHQQLSQEEDPNYGGVLYVDRETGAVLSDANGAEQVFVVAQLTVENVNAENGLLYLNDVWKDLYGEETDCTIQAYDFDAHGFGIDIKKEEGFKSEYTGYNTWPAYFSRKNELYDDAQRENYYRLEPGETISFEIGQFLPVSIINEEQLGRYGGAVGDDLIPRFCVTTSNGMTSPLVTLNLK